MNKLLLLSIILLVYSCNDRDVVNEDLSIVYNGCIDISSSKFKICFDSIKDSRCPTDLVCIWEGDAITYLSLNSGEDKKSIALHTNNVFQQDTLIDGLRIKLLDVLPYPDKDIEPNSSKYIAKIEVVLE